MDQNERAFQKQPMLNAATFGGTLPDLNWCCAKGDRGVTIPETPESPSGFMTQTA